MSIARSITTLSRRSLIKGAASLGALIPLSALVAGCSTDDEAAPDTDEQAPVTENEPSGSAGTAGATAAGGSVLVAYYSAQGHTEAVAQAIADELGADLFAVTPAEPYTDADLDWTDDESRVSREHDDESLRNVALSQVTPDGWEGYDTVFVGYPIWWGIAAWPIDNFISGNDWGARPSSRSAPPHRRASGRAVSFWPRPPARATGRRANASRPTQTRTRCALGPQASRKPKKTKGMSVR